MNDAECVAFLQWALPRMRLAWRGFRNVRRTVCGRVNRRFRTVGLRDLASYRAYLEASPPEWEELRALCSIPISRFYRDREVFESLEHAVLPQLCDGAIQRGERTLECWSAGCASGEEPYTLSVLWQLRLAARYAPRLQLRVLGTDIDPVLLDRAAAACYRSSALKELPLSWRSRAFEQRAGEWCLRPPFREGVRLVRQDICASMPDQHFDLILCRNVVFTYFAPELQDPLAQRLLDRLHPGGALVLGLHESFPPAISGVAPWPRARAVLRRVLSPSTDLAVARRRKAVPSPRWR